MLKEIVNNNGISKLFTKFMFIKFIAILFTILFSLSSVHSQGKISVELEKVIDGDTVYLVDNNKKKYKVRLHAIDTPEKGQIYFLRAKEALFKLISNKSLTLEKINYDKYGRVVGIIYADNENVNYQMIQHGHAWCYRKYNKNPKFIEAEENAKSKKIGLWSLEEKNVAPWEWRKKSAK